jgi:uncharacterized DUF497 family protein
MRLRWDENKRQLVLRRRNIDFAQLENLLLLPYIEDQRLAEPEQYRIIGFIHARLTTFIVEYRTDQIGTYMWIVTAWRSTHQEMNSYEQATR